IDAKDKLANCFRTSESSREDVIAIENKICIEVIRKEYGGKSQLAAVMKFIKQKMPDCNLGGSRQDPESSGTCYTSASSNPSRKIFRL
ncbi:hypothetical protein ACMD2_25111, partial [Ananas comosus]